MRYNLFLLGLGVLGLSGSASANLLVNGDFESQPNWGMGVSGDFGYSALTGTQIPGWTIEAGHAMTVHNPNWYPYISGYSLNMDGEGYNGVNGDIYQDFGSTNGQKYAVDFDHLGWFSTSTIGLEVSVVDTVTSAVLYNSVTAWVGPLGHVTGGFVGTGNTLRLRINEAPASNFNDNAWIVDNLSVEAVPEPASLCALGLGAAAFLRRRKA